MSKHLYFFKSGRSAGVRLLLMVLLTAAASGASIQIWGPFDIDNDSNSELLLILNKKGGPAIEWVENIPDDGIKSLWSFSLPKDVSGFVTDAQIFDLDNDGYPECIFTLLTIGLESKKEMPGFYVFRGQPDGFSKDALTLSLKNDSGMKIRPTGLTLLTRNNSNYIIISQGTPVRNLLSFNIELNDGGLERGDIVVLNSELINSGFNPVYAGNIGPSTRPNPIVFSIEDDKMKIATFNMDDSGKATLDTEKTISFPGSFPGAAFGMGITSFDWDGNDNIELLIPFYSGQVLALDISSGQPVLIEPELERQLLSSGDPASLENEMEKIFSQETARILKAQKAINVDTLYLNAENRDTLILGEQLSLPAARDTSNRFYSFLWETKPPAGCTFDPETGKINWLPTQDQMGPHVLIYRYEARKGTEHQMFQDKLGDAHQMVPILDEETITFALFVEDSAKQYQPTTLSLDDLISEEPVPVDMFTLTLTRPTDEPDKAYIFSGQPPFGMKAREMPIQSDNEGAVISYTVLGNLAQIDPGHEASFSYHPTQNDLEYESTLTLVQDFENNLILVSREPASDTLPQWIDPENYDASLYLFPQFYFEGFGKGLKAAAEPGGINFSFFDQNAPERIQASIKIQLPSSTPEELLLYFQEGEIGEMSGNIKVRENGSRKIELKIKTMGQILLSSIIARGKLEPVFMEELVDEIDVPAVPLLPDTIQTEISTEEIPADTGMPLINIVPEIQDSSLLDSTLILQESADSTGNE